MTDNRGAMVERFAVTVRSGNPLRDRHALLVLIAFSAFYFSYVLLLASTKYLWVDEISTVLIASAPNVKAIREAPKHVPDFLPTIFYLIVRASRALFGGGLIATRLPSILGVYVLCVSIFAFVHRRVGIVGGLVAMLFPLITGAFPYSFEARPYGLEMGFAGLALLCWQLNEDRVNGWLTLGFAFSLFGAACMHPFGICLAGVFFVYEIYSAVTNRRIHALRILALAIPVAIAALTYLPIVSDFRATVSHAHFAVGGSVITASGAEGSAESTYDALFGQCLMLVLVYFAVFVAALTVRRNTSSPVERSGVPTRDVVISAVLLGAPIIAVCLAVVEKSQYFPRYVSWTVAGVALLFGLAAGTIGRSNRIGVAMAIILAAVLLRNFSTPFRKCLVGQAVATYTPADKVVQFVPAGKPIALHDLLDGHLPDLPIVTPSLKDFVYLEYYSSALRDRTYYIYAERSNYGRYYIDGFRGSFQAPFTEPVSTGDVRRMFPAVLYYGAVNEDNPGLLALTQAGAQARSVRTSSDGTHVLMELRFE